MTLAELDVKTAAKAHVQRIDVVAVCDFCSKAQTLIYAEHELRKTKDPQLDAPEHHLPNPGVTSEAYDFTTPITAFSVLCPVCGGSMQPSNVDGSGPLRCAACRT
jgi:hypothetical protein